jgi:hypothetical protein
MKEQSKLADPPVNVKIKIAALWMSVMFCYIYADYFALFAPGKLQDMLTGNMPPLGKVTEGVLVFTSAMLAIPSVMIFLSVSLPATLNRWINVFFGSLYTLIILLTMWAWAFTIFYGVIEVVLTSVIVWYALRWPKQSSADQGKQI